MGGQRVLDIRLGRQDRFFVGSDRLVGQRVLHADVGSDGAGVEHRPAHGRPDRPVSAAPVEEVPTLRAFQPEAAGQAKAWEQIGNSDALASGRGGQLALGAANVGPSTQQVAGQTGRHDLRPDRHRGRLRQLLIQRLRRQRQQRSDRSARLRDLRDQRRNRRRR